MRTDYKFYTETYGGSLIPCESFDYYCGLAESYLDAATMGRDTSLFDKPVQHALCELAELEYKTENNMIVASETVGRYSVSYRNGAETPVNTLKKNILKRRLGHTGLLYRGV